MIFEKDLEDTYVNNFEVFWNDFDKHYSFFELKQIDWDSVYHEYQSQVSAINADIELFSMLEEIVLSLQDGHTNLYALGNTVRYDFTEGFPANSPEFAQDYLENIQLLNANLSFGDIKNSELGYLKINSFGGDRAVFEMIDNIFDRIENKNALIIDVRDNGGGSDRNSNYISSKFADSRQVYRKVKYRNGPGHGDFTEWIESFVNPAERTFTKPIAVLTNRHCYSTTEGFIASLKVFDYVSTVGGITGGGSGNPIFKELPNGWNYRLSNWLVDYTAFGIVEGVGQMPDYLVEITDSDIDLKRDVILEKAIELLK